MKKFISVMLIVVIMFSLCGTAYAGSEETVDDCDFCCSEGDCSGECCCDECAAEEPEVCAEEEPEFCEEEILCEDEPAEESESANDPLAETEPPIEEPAETETPDEGLQNLEEVCEEEILAETPETLPEEETGTDEVILEETVEPEPEDAEAYDPSWNNTDYFPESGYYAGNGKNGIGKGAPIPDEETLYIPVNYTCYTTQEGAGEMLEALNELRSEFDSQCEPLQLSRSLMEYAVTRAKVQSYIFGHAGAGNVLMSNGDCIGISGEIIVLCSQTGLEKSVAQAISSWKSSSGHYSEITDPDFLYCGICALTYMTEVQEYTYWVVCFCCEEENISSSGTTYKFSEHPEDLADPSEYANSERQVWSTRNTQMPYYELWEYMLMTGDVLEVDENGEMYCANQNNIDIGRDIPVAGFADGGSGTTIRPGEELEIHLETEDTYQLSLYEVGGDGARYLEGDNADEETRNVIRNGGINTMSFFPDIDQLHVEISNPEVCELEYFTPEGTCLKNSARLVAKQAGTATVTFWFEGYSAATFTFKVTVCACHEWEESRDVLEGKTVLWQTIEECPQVYEINRVCKNCGYVPNAVMVEDHGHEMEEKTIQETPCSSYTVSTCVYCGYEVYTETVTEHELSGEPVEVIAPTCQSSGLIGYRCSRCDEIVYETDPDNPDPVFCEIDPDTYVVTREPTCSSYGYATGTCRWCGKTLTEVIQPLCENWGEHTEEGLENGYWDVQVEATYTERGYKVFYCGCCGNMVKYEYIPVLEHECEYGEEVQISKASCSATGYIRVYLEEYNGITFEGYMQVSLRYYNVYTKTCTKCGKEVNRVEYVGLNHNWEVTESTPATCQSAEQTVYVCADCGTTKTETGTEYAEHNWDVESHSDPTCIAMGKTVYICPDCGETKTEYENELGHNFEYVYVAPTETEDGYSEWVCTRCGNTRDHVDYPANGHTWDEGAVTQEATCELDEITTYTCTGCGETEERVTGKALGHSYELVTVAPTCDEAGYSEKVCTRCGDVILHEDLPATGEHTWGSGTITKKPSAVTEGEIMYECTECGAVKTEEIPADEKYGFFAGDVNGDGYVNSLDLVSMIRLILGLIPSVKGNADINADSKVNLMDAVALLKMLVDAG